MSRPVNKEELIAFAEHGFNELLDFINELPENIKSKTYKNNELNDRDKTIADVICHLHEWHLMRENWYKEGMSGKKPALSYSLRTLPIINHAIWEKYKGTELRDAITMFKKSHKAIMVLIEKHNDEELFSKKKYEFTGSTTLGAYFYFNTADHYRWALKTIQPLKKPAK
ncbi:MAG: ClbS/DfsB family four-helix bundle protein [Treponema sp.]|jgi:hypothetical protein|nr:ClbS/DfsB family four-helix bundle protein [Treponema sp.]